MKKNIGLHKRRVVLWVAAAASAIGIGIALLNRTAEWQIVGPLQPLEVRAIPKTVSQARWKWVWAGITTGNLRQAFWTLQEMVLGRTRVVTSDSAGRANVVVRDRAETDRAETGRRWEYHLEHRAEGWKVIVIGSRRSRPGPPLDRPGGSNQPPLPYLDTNQTSAAAGSVR